MAKAETGDNSGDSSGDAPAEITFSFVVPVQNEQEGLEHFIGRLELVADELGEPYEILLVNDGSTDDTASVIRRLAETDTHIKCVELSRSFGRQVALLAGHDFACGKAVISLAADGRHRPEFIPDLVARWREGFEVVYTQRRETAGAGEGWPARATQCVARRLVRAATGSNLLDREDFRLLDRKAVGALRLHREADALTAVLTHVVGFRRVAVPYVPEPSSPARPERRALRPLAATVAELVCRSRLPAHLAAATGGVLLAAAVLYAVVALILWPCGAAPPVWLSVLAVIVGLFGLQFLMLGMLGEYLVGAGDQARGRPRYLVRDTVGFPATESPSAKAKAKDDWVVFT